jgi:hypothetical protein
LEENGALFLPEHIPNIKSEQAGHLLMGLGRHTRSRPKVNYGSVEITEERAIYTDSKNVRWRLYDFAQSTNGKKSPVRVGSISATMRIFVREDGRERRLITFNPRDDTLLPKFSYHQLPTAKRRRLGRWVDVPSDELERRTADPNHPLSKSPYH